MCDEGVVEDEFHVILNCSKYSDLRQQVFNEIAGFNGNFNDTVPFTPKVNTQTHFFLKCAAARRRAMCEIHMYGQRTFGAVPILNLSFGARNCDHV